MSKWSLSYKTNPFTSKPSGVSVQVDVLPQYSSDANTVLVNQEELQEDLC